MRITALLSVVLVAAASASAARLPGVRTPSRNIDCFFVPERPTTHGHLLCNIRRANYAVALQRQCISPPTGLDWHGFEVPETKRAQVVCAGGIMYDARDRPSPVTLAYGRTWRFKTFTCISRRTGLTCTNRRGHGLFLSRETYRLF